MWDHKINVNIISIRNKYGDLKCQCPLSKKKGEVCVEWRYHGTKAWVNYSIIKLILNIYPIGICEHGYICDVYFYHHTENVGLNPKHKHNLNKMYLNKQAGDELVNGPEFFTLIPWNQGQSESHPLQRAKQRHYVDSEFLIALNQSQLIQCMLFIHIYKFVLMCFCYKISAIDTSIYGNT